MHDLPEGFFRILDCCAALLRRIFLRWILLAIALGVFYKKASYETKRSLHPFITIGVGMLFLAFGEGISHGTFPVASSSVAVVLITYRISASLNYALAVAQPYVFRAFSRPQFCPKCGAELER